MAGCGTAELRINPGWNNLELRSLKTGVRTIDRAIENCNADCRVAKRTGEVGDCVQDRIMIDELVASSPFLHTTEMFAIG
jgi:uncharacterized Fe-S radical SAM superfamily protein PflX